MGNQLRMRLGDRRNAGREEGTRARNTSATGSSAVALGQGFLSHRKQALRAALQDGSLSTRDYFSQLLRLVYRLIFLLTVEERNLHPEGTPDAARSLYAGSCACGSCRKGIEAQCTRSIFRRSESTKLVFHGMAAGEARLGLPALAGAARNQCPAPDAAKLENRALLLAVQAGQLREDGALARVNWRDMGPEELGSVYESLLELVPQISKEGRQFGLPPAMRPGNARKTTGSYCTPDSLVRAAGQPLSGDRRHDREES
jgi:hypothetical protein